MEYTIKMFWDEEASVWVATSEDIPGLVLESGSFDALIERVKVAAPEMLRENNKPTINSIRYITDCRQKVYVNG